MNKLISSMIMVFSCQIMCFSQAYAGNTINVSGWKIEIQDDGTCALGKTFEFGKRDSLVVAITSYGQVSILSDKEFTGDIEIDGENIIHPVRSISGDMHMYSDSDDRNSGKVFVTYFKLGNVAKIKLKNGDTRTLKLSGFTKAYNQYKKCAR